ncbi:hypothetical protein C8R48DRAFT_782984 [Suillus tomentosus]|nr:hypothetical protein C8R48DRAFT_782984 [Suillus tomentosus]
MPMDPYWSSEQLEYLDDNSAMYSYCYKDDDLIEFWPSFFEAFFACWPEHQTLLADIPKQKRITNVPKDRAAATKTLSNPIAMIKVTGPANANAMDSAVHIKRVLIKSRWNELLDAIGTDGVSFLVGRENHDIGLDTEALSSLKRPTQNEVPSAPKKKRTKA